MANQQRPLTDRERRFIEEYTGGKNRFVGSYSAINAGYSEKTAYSIANELLGKPHIQAAVEERMKELAERCAVNVETITRQLSDAYELAMCGVVDRGQGKPPAVANASPAAAVAAAMGLAKLHGLIVDKKAETTPDGKPLPPSEIRVTLVRPDSRSTDT